MSLFVDAVKAEHIDHGPVVLLGVDIGVKSCLIILTNGKLATCHIDDLKLETDWVPAPAEGAEDVD